MRCNFSAASRNARAALKYPRRISPQLRRTSYGAASRVGTRVFGTGGGGPSKVGISAFSTLSLARSVAEADPELSNEILSSTFARLPKTAE